MWLQVYLRKLAVMFVMTAYLYVYREELKLTLHHLVPEQHTNYLNTIIDNITTTVQAGCFLFDELGYLEGTVFGYLSTSIQAGQALLSDFANGYLSLPAVTVVLPALHATRQCLHFVVEFLRASAVTAHSTYDIAHYLWEGIAYSLWHILPDSVLPLVCFASVIAITVELLLTLASAVAYLTRRLLGAPITGME